MKSNLESYLTVAQGQIEKKRKELLKQTPQINIRIISYSALSELIKEQLSNENMHHTNGKTR